MRGQKVLSKRVHPGAVWVANNRVYLQKKYREQWIAVDPTGLVAHHKTDQGLLRALEKLGIHPSNTYITFIENLSK